MPQYLHSIGAFFIPKSRRECMWCIFSKIPLEKAGQKII